MKTWIEMLDEEDRGFLKRFILASGSLKALAEAYKISYPTVRLRLDRMIERIKVLDDPGIQSPFERILRTRYADGRIDMETLRVLLDAHQREIGGK